MAITQLAVFEAVNAVTASMNLTWGRSQPAQYGVNDSLVTSFATKYHYDVWRPETAIRAGNTDGNPQTEPDINFAPLIAPPCFPSFPSNHASGSYGGAEVLERIYGAGRHSTITLTTSVPVPVPGSPTPMAVTMTRRCTKFKEITDDIDDARVYGGIHFRFDQEAGARLGREVGGYVYRHNLRPDH
jgi:PAP2 superfamily